MPVKTDTEMIDDVAVVHCNGKITLGEGATAVRTALQSLLGQKRSEIVFDIAEVPYIDSSGFGELVRGFSETMNKGGALVLARASQRIQDVLRHTRLSTVFRTFETVEDAVAYIKKARRPRN